MENTTLPSIWFRYSTPVDEPADTCQVCASRFRDGDVVTDGDDGQLIHEGCYFAACEEQD